MISVSMCEKKFQRARPKKLIIPERFRWVYTIKNSVTQIF